MNRFASAVLLVSLMTSLAPGSRAQLRFTKPPPQHPKGTLPGNAATIARCEAQLRSPKRQVRLGAVETLSRVRSNDVPASIALSRALKDKDAEVRSLSLKALKRRVLSKAPIVSALAEHLKYRDTSPEIQLFALNVLKQWGGPPSRAAGPDVLRLMQSPSPAVRLAALHGYTGGERAAYLQAVHRLLQDPEEKIRLAAAMNICRNLPQEAVSSEALPLVFAGLNSSVSDTRNASASTLGNLLTALASRANPPESHTALADRVVTAVLPLMKDPVSEVRHSALLALSSAQYGTGTDAPPAVVTAVAERLTEKDSSLRSIAARYFIEHRGDFSPAAPALLQLLKIPLPTSDNTPDNTAWEARTYAFLVLGKIARTDEGARNALLELLSSRPRNGFEAKYEATYGPGTGAFEALADASVARPELVSKLLEHIQGIAEPLKSEKLSALMYAQKDRPETFSILTENFDREDLATRQKTLFILVYQKNWTMDHSIGKGGIGGIVPSKTTLAYDWMKTKLLQDKDAMIRETAAHGIKYSPAP